MTIKQLTKKLKEIPASGAINRARRAQIIALIMQMEGEGR